MKILCTSLFRSHAHDRFHISAPGKLSSMYVNAYRLKEYLPSTFSLDLKVFLQIFVPENLNHGEF